MLAYPRRVCFAPHSDQIADTVFRQLRARSRHRHQTRTRGRLRFAAEVEDGAGKLFRSFLWRIVPDVFEYAALVVAGKETLVSLRFLRRVHLVIGAMNYNRRDAILGKAANCASMGA